jgi:hypothetical protein
MTMTKAELYLAYDYKRVALEADKKEIAEGQPPPDNYQELVDAVEAPHRAWEDAPE